MTALKFVEKVLVLHGDETEIRHHQSTTTSQETDGIARDILSLFCVWVYSNG